MQFILKNKNPPVVEFNYDVAKISEFVKLNSDKVEFASTVKYDLDFAGEDLRQKLPEDVYFKSPAVMEFRHELRRSLRDCVKILTDACDTGCWPKGSEAAIEPELYMYTIPFIYREGFAMNTHQDTRLSFAQGYLNLDDNESCTEIFTTRIPGEAGYRMSGEKNVGYIWLNTKNNWHRVNTITRERTVLLFNFALANF